MEVFSDVDGVDSVVVKHTGHNTVSNRPFPRSLKHWVRKAMRLKKHVHSNRASVKQCKSSDHIETARKNRELGMCRTKVV